MMDGPLDHPKALRGGQHRYEAVHALVEDEPAGHVGPHHLQAAVVIVEPQACAASNQTIEDPRWPGLVPGIEPRGLPAVDEIDATGLEQGEHPRKFLGVVLAVAVEHRDLRGPATAEADRERRRLAEPAGLMDSLHPRVEG
jgi:hypothetical protein